MGVNEGILIMNPCDYTIQPEETDSPIIQKSSPKKVDLEE
jgi:hypothetical protein